MLLAIIAFATVAVVHEYRDMRREQRRARMMAQHGRLLDDR